MKHQNKDFKTMSSHDIKFVDDEINQLVSDIVTRFGDNKPEILSAAIRVGMYQIFYKGINLNKILKFPKRYDLGKNPLDLRGK